MELKDLVGEHELSGVDFGERPPDRDNYQYQAANTMTFVLDGKAYMAVEDPSMRLDSKAMNVPGQNNILCMGYARAKGGDAW